MIFAQKKTRAGQNAGIPEKFIAGDDTSSLPDSVDNAAVFGQMLNGIYIVVAEIQCETGKRFRRRFYANLPSAQRAVDRAVMNGREAYLYLGKVSIIGGDAQ